MVSKHWSGNPHFHYPFHCTINQNILAWLLTFHFVFRAWMSWSFLYSLLVQVKLKLILVSTVRMHGTCWEGKRLAFCLLYCQIKMVAYMVIFIMANLVSSLIMMYVMSDATLNNRKFQKDLWDRDWDHVAMLSGETCYSCKSFLLR